MKITALLPASSWMIFMILLNHKIVTISAFFFGLDILFDIGLNFLIDTFSYQDGEEVEEVTMTDIVEKLDGIERIIKQSEKTIIHEIGHMIKYESVMRDVAKDLDYIRRLYEQFEEYSSGYEPTTVKNFAKICLTLGDNGLTYKLDDIMNLVSPEIGERTPLLALIAEPYTDPVIQRDHCGKTVSIQQELYTKFGEIGLYLVKGYIMKFNAYKILRKSGEGQFKKEKKYTRKAFKNAMRKLIRAAVDAMSAVSRDIRSCDPLEHEEDETYIQLKWLFNGILIDPKYLSDEPHCPEECEFYMQGELHHWRSSSEWALCSGKLHDCFTTKGVTRNRWYFCPGTKNGIRYDAVGAYKPIHDQCAETLQQVTDQFNSTVESHSRIDYYECSICSCACDDTNHPETVRRFSLNPVQSKHEENQVITGLRFVQQDRVIYIQIQEGKLEDHGVIDESTVQWQPIIPSEGADWVIGYEDKSINLDILDSPSNRALTGIRFNMYSANLDLNILVHSFDYSSGLLNDADGVWLSSGVTSRKAIRIEKSKSPIDATERNIEVTDNDRSVNFHMTDWDEDSSQTAYPFIDAQSVISEPPRVLSGAGIYYRGQEGYGGFIALKLVSYNYAGLLAEKDLSRPAQKTAEKETAQETAEEETAQETAEETAEEETDLTNFERPNFEVPTKPKKKVKRKGSKSRRGRRGPKKLRKPKFRIKG